MTIKQPCAECIYCYQWTKTCKGYKNLLCIYATSGAHSCEGPRRMKVVFALGEGDFLGHTAMILVSGYMVASSYAADNCNNYCGVYEASDRQRLVKAILAVHICAIFVNYLLATVENCRVYSFELGIGSARFGDVECHTPGLLRIIRVPLWVDRLVQRVVVW
jgi:hypothetical protein